MTTEVNDTEQYAELYDELYVDQQTSDYAYKEFKRIGKNGERLILLKRRGANSQDPSSFTLGLKVKTPWGELPEQFQKVYTDESLVNQGIKQKVNETLTEFVDNADDKLVYLEYAIPSKAMFKKILDQMKKKPDTIELPISHPDGTKRLNPTENCNPVWVSS